MAATYTDAAGNSPAGPAESANYIVDSNPPSAPLVTSVSGIIGDDNLYVNAAEITASSGIVIGGTGEPAAAVEIKFSDDFVRVEGDNLSIVDGDGNWSAYFGNTLDIVPGIGGSAT